MMCAGIIRLIGAVALLSRSVKAVAVSTPTGTGIFAPWPQPLVEAHGDYRDEVFLEHLVGGPLYSKQQDLPRLPVPSLDETINRFLPTALPLAKDEHEKQTLLDACRKFPQEAKVLQERLLQRQKEFSDSSWLQEMWQTMGYLQVRDPVAVKVSYFLYVPDDRTLPTENAGIARAAAMLVAMAESRKQICSGQMPYETIPHRDGEEEPLCSTGFKYLFHSCRVPARNQDAYHLYDPSLYKHCVVACRGHFFAVDFCDNQGDPLPLAILEQRLQRCVDLAAKQQKGFAPQMGWLTSSDRDFWADARQELLQVGGSRMKEALHKLESGAFVLNLDDEEPQSLTESGKVFWHGGESCGGNRWFDKSIQLICTANGKVGYLGEHSMLDAAPVIPLIRRIMKTTYKRLKKKQKSDQHDESNSPDAGVSNIFEDCWSSLPVTAAATDLTSAAKEHHKKLTGDYELQVELFEGYGKKLIKQAGFMCYDYAQMALQLAAYRLLGQQVATYEAAMTRAFLHGRTETARPVSPESNAFIECMGLKPHEGNYNEKFSLLKKAAAVHDDWQSMASKGLGVDRHLFGLSSMVREGDEAPSLFSHPLFQESKRWRLSTSSVIFTPGFGPVQDDGIGIGFRVDSDSCMFVCTSLKENNYIKPFCNLLEEALTEMGELIKMNEDESPSSE